MRYSISRSSRDLSRGRIGRGSGGPGGGLGRLTPGTTQSTHSKYHSNLVVLVQILDPTVFSRTCHPMYIEHLWQQDLHYYLSTAQVCYNVLSQSATNNSNSI